MGKYIFLWGSITPTWERACKNGESGELSAFVVQVTSNRSRFCWHEWRCEQYSDKNVLKNPRQRISMLPCAHLRELNYLLHISHLSSIWMPGMLGNGRLKKKVASKKWNQIISLWLVLSLVSTQGVNFTSLLVAWKRGQVVVAYDRSIDHQSDTLLDANSVDLNCR